MIHNIEKILKEKWIIQLHAEYESIVYQYGLRKLKKPLLVIDNLKKCWGYWDKNRVTIFISEELIKKYSWDIVLQVLKHEIAHQIVSELFLVEDNHGHYFKSACKMIGLDDEYSRASLSIDEKFLHWKHKKADSEEESLLNKIQKLLNLAQSSNENEAALAMERVQELYEKYNIQSAKLGQKNQYFKLTINFEKKRIPVTYSIASFILQQHFFVKVIFSNIYHAFLDTHHKTIEIMGSRQNVLMAEYVFYFLVERIEILWLNYSKLNRLSVKFKLSYQQGVLNGFSNKLDAAKEARANENKINEPHLHALIKLNDIKLNEFVQFKFPKVVSQKTSSRGVYSEHFNQGVEEGKKININKPLNSGSKKNVIFQLDS